MVGDHGKLLEGVVEITMTCKHFKTRGMQGLFPLIGLLALTLDVSASERKIEAEVLAKSTKDWRGVTLPPYSEGQPEVTVARVTIPAGMALPLHEHPYMTAGVIVQGTIEVRTDSGDTHIARAGDAVIELVNQAHGGANIGDEDAVILVVYAGVEGEPVTVPFATP